MTRVARRPVARTLGLALAAALWLVGPRAAGQEHGGEHAAPGHEAVQEQAHEAVHQAGEQAGEQASGLAAGHAGDAHAAAGQAAEDHAGGHDGEHQMGAAEIFLGLYKHLEPHPITAVWFGGSEGFGLIKPFVCDADGNPLVFDEHDHPVKFHTSAELNEHYADLMGGGFGFLVYNINTSMWIAAGLLLLVTIVVARTAFRRGAEAPRGAFYHVVESMVLFVRDDMVYSVMGKHHGRRFVPLFLTQFFFILSMNILGLVWLGDVGGTATANLAVTGGLAITTLIWINLAGMREHGFFQYWKNYAPHGLPFFVVPIIVLIELASNLLIKPAALTIRLFANMTAGHLVMLSLFGLIVLAGSAGAAITAIPTFALVIAIACLELFVAFVQAYIFTYLSIIFVGASVHPEH